MYMICEQMQAELCLPTQRLVWHRSMLLGKLDPAVSRDTLGCKLCHTVHKRFTSPCAFAAGVCRDDKLFDVVACYQLAIKALSAKSETVTMHRAVAAYLCQASELRKVSISIPILREIRKAVVRLAVQL